MYFRSLPGLWFVFFDVSVGGLLVPLSFFFSPDGFKGDFGRSILLIQMFQEFFFLSGATLSMGGERR